MPAALATRASKDDTRYSSTVAPAEPDTRYSSSVDRRFRDIDRRRRAAKITIEKLCRAAGVSFWTWRAAARGDAQITESTLSKFSAALETITPTPPLQVIAAFHRMLFIWLARELRLPVPKMLAQDLSKQRPANKDWLNAARLHRLAIYFVTVELEVGNATLARAIGCTRQNVKDARDQVEDLREQPRIDRAIARIADQLRTIGEKP